MSNGLTRRLKLLARRSYHALPTAIGIVILDFFLLRLTPGDAADAIAAESGAATVETMTKLREHFGLNLSTGEQLYNYLSTLFKFSLGMSPRFNVPVMDLIMQRLPGTLVLMTVAIIIALVLGLTFGIAMSAAAGRLPDRILSVIALLFYSIPSFWIGLMLIVLFSVQLHLLPSGGSGTIGSDLTGLPAFLDGLRYLVLPATSLALFYLAIYSRITRASMLETKSMDFVRTARAKGVRPLRISVNHVLRNALIPVTTIAGMHIGGILGGAVVIETVYSWPGLGRLAIESILSRDFSVLLGVLLLSSFMVIIVNILVDLVQAELDPRIEAEQ